VLEKLVNYKDERRLKKGRGRVEGTEERIEGRHESFRGLER
jgi:hypothetical protein